MTRSPRDPDAVQSTTMTPRLILADSPWTRYATGSLMYFAQGIPTGLVQIAIPAWLASRGVGAGEIATFLAIVTLPWAFKLLSAPLMDRFEFLAMGRRRPWVLGAQLGLTVSFLALLLVGEPTEQLRMLTLLGAMINVFAATQDVAVDGMSIDLTPVEEQGRLNAFMTFGKAVGWAISSAVSGVLLATFGLGPTAVFAATACGFVLLAFALVVERDGERKFPWGRGEPATQHRPAQSMATLLKGLNAVLWTRVSVIVMLVMCLDGLVHGYGHALMPIAAVKLFGFTAAEWSQLVAVMGFVGAAAALALGPLIDRLGAKRMLSLTVVVVGAHAFLLAEAQSLWTDALFVRVMLSIWVMLVPVTMVCVIALAMAICSSASSATQFAIYMSIANLGSSAGAKLYGVIADGVSYSGAYILLGALTLSIIGILSAFRHRPNDGRHKPGRLAPRYTIGMGASGAGIFWSGAMRCPKCRSDMETVELDGIEIDRCAECKGIWFDPGELDKLRSRRAAGALDTGDASTGLRHNAIDQYRCPRCGGHMIRMVDAQQSHIWYEQCASCHGSYFDAGELSDLVRFSIADIIKRFKTPARS